MPQAKITVNAVPGSNVALPINTVVALNNQNVGGESTYSWTILDQPPGTVDALTATAIQNPSFTPRKEGSYLLKLVVNSGLPTEQEDRVVCAVKQLKTLERIPAAGETTEADTSDGWATAMNSLLRRIDTLLSDPGILVGVNASGSTLTRGQVVRTTSAAVIKSSLPGQETVPGFTLAQANVLGQIDELLCVVEGAPDGSASIPGSGSAEARLMRVRYIGRLASITPGGTAAVGDTVYVNDAGSLSLTQGTIRRRLGSAMSAGTTFDVWVNGVGGADIDLTPINAPYVTYGNPLSLSNPQRTDGTNNNFPSGGVPFQLRAQDISTITAVLRRFSSGGQAIQQWQTEGGTVLAQVAASGQLQLAQGLSVDNGVTVQTGNVFLPTSGQQIELVDGDLLIDGAGRGITWSAYRLFDDSAISGTLTVQDVGTGGTVQFSFSSATTTGIALNTAVGNTVLVRDQSVGTRLIHYGNRPIIFATGAAGTDKWSVQPSGELTAEGGIRQIKFVANPTLDQDAVTLAHQRANTSPNNNLIINGDFRWWQRRTSTGYIDLVPSFSGGYSRAYQFGAVQRTAYLADRWCAFTRNDGGVDPFVPVRYSRSTAVPLGSTSRYSARLEWFGGPADCQGVAALSQEIDRSIVRAHRGQTVTFSFWMQGYIDPDFLLIEVVSGTGSEDLPLPSYSSGTILASFFDGPYGGLPWLRWDLSFVIPANATTLAVYVGGYVFGYSTGGGYVEIADARLVKGAVLPDSQFSRHAATELEELAVCQRFYEKSWEPDTNTGTATNLGSHVTNVLAVGAGALGTFAMGAHPRFSVTKYKTPTVDVYNSAGTSFQWSLDVSRATIAVNSSPSGFEVGNGTLGVVTPAATGVTRGHWTADADI